MLLILFSLGQIPRQMSIARDILRPCDMFYFQHYSFNLQFALLESILGTYIAPPWTTEATVRYLKSFILLCVNFLTLYFFFSKAVYNSSSSERVSLIRDFAKT